MSISSPCKTERQGGSNRDSEGKTLASPKTLFLSDIEPTGTYNASRIDCIGIEESFLSNETSTENQKEIGHFRQSGQVRHFESTEKCPFSAYPPITGYSAFSGQRDNSRDDTTCPDELSAEGEEKSWYPGEPPTPTRASPFSHMLDDITTINSHEPAKQVVTSSAVSAITSGVAPAASRGEDYELEEINGNEVPVTSKEDRDLCTPASTMPLYDYSGEAKIVTPIENETETQESSRFDAEDLPPVPSFTKAHAVPQEAIVVPVATRAHRQSNQRPANPKPRFSPSKSNRIYLSSKAITDEDVRCGRKERGTVHPGNIRYRRIIQSNRTLYESFGSKHGKKTNLSSSIVESEIKGRFVKPAPGKKRKGFSHVLLTREEARTKVSQSLREKPDQRAS